MILLPYAVILVPMPKKLSAGKIITTIAFPLFILLTLVMVFIFRREIWQVFATPEKIQAAVDRWGAAAPLAFIGLQFVQVAVFVIPGEIPQIAGGYLFGLLWGSLYSLIGICAGSAFNFYLARLLGVPFVKRLFKEDQIKKFDGITHSPRAQIGFFLLFLIPGIPKDILCYIAGLSPLRFGAFLLISMIGRLPGIIGSAAMGNAAASSRWILTVILIVLSTLLFIFGMIFREKVHVYIERVALKKKSNNGDEPL